MTDRELYIQRVPEVGHELMLPHVEAPGSRMVFLDDNPDKYPAQRPMYHYVEGTPVDPKNLVELGRIVDPRYPETLEALFADLKSMKAARSAAKILKRGGGILLVSPHVGDLIDVPFAKNAFDLSVEQQGYSASAGMAVIAKSLGWTGYDLKLGIPDEEPVNMIETVGSTADIILLPWARTEASRKALDKLPQSEVDRHNKQGVRNDFAKFFEEEAVAAVMAATGTTRIKRLASGLLEVSGINSATAEMMMDDEKRKTDIHVMGVPILRNERVFSIALQEPVKIRSKDQAHAFMGNVIEGVNTFLEDKNLVYGGLSQV